MKKLILAALCCCPVWVHAVPTLSCDDLVSKAGLLPGQQFSSVQLSKIQEFAKAQPELTAVVMGLLQICGLGVPKNAEAALSIWKAAAPEGRTNAFLMIVGFYFGAFGDAPDNVKAAEWLTFAAQRGDPELQLALGNEYLLGGVFPKDVAQAERWFLKSAGQGNAEAQENLGEIYLDAKRYPEALQWLNLSALQGRMRAQLLVGNLYYFGLGVKQDPATAMKWWRLAAEQKDAMAQFNLGFGYEAGAGVDRNQAEAIKRVRLSAEQGLLRGMEAMAKLYEFGIGSPQDRAMAFDWWKKLAERQYLPAQIRVGWMYIGGAGVAKNAAEGIKWFRSAAERDMPEAHMSLALAYEYGLGVPVDLEVAHQLRLKKRNGPYASELIDSCAFLSDGQLDEQDARDYRWKLLVLLPQVFTRKAEHYLAARKPKDALCWYQRAADALLANGLTSLGNAYLAKGDIPTNPTLGIHYLRVGAAQGSVSARVRLAQVFQAGEVVPKNMAVAYALRFATSRAPEELDSVLEGYHSSIEDEMTSDEIFRAKQLIREMAVPGQYLIALDRALVQ
jgi:TPR repeat protein